MEEQKSTKEVIEEEVIYQAQSIKDLEFGSEEYSRAVKGVEGLYKQTIEDSKVDIEWTEKEKELELKEKELELKEKELEQARNQAKMEFWKGVGITAASILIPAALHWKLSMKGFEFEETGTIGSNSMRGVQNAEQAFVKRHM